MKIRNVVPRGLLRFVESDDASGLAPHAVERIRNILSFLLEMEEARELHDVPGWTAHQLTGRRKGTWSLSVTPNWRITFKIDTARKELYDLGYEDYH